MANAAQQQQKKMQYKMVDFDVNEIAPDAPVGEWMVSIPRGKCKVQPTKEHGFPMVIVPIRLDAAEEEGPDFEKALGTELSVFLIFGGKDARAERLGKIRIRQLCEAADVDLELVPKKWQGDDPEAELQPLIRALEGKKFKAWTKHQLRKDTGEIQTELLLLDPNAPISTAIDDDEPAAAAPARGGKNGKTTNGRARR